LRNRRDVYLLKIRLLEVRQKGDPQKMIWMDTFTLIVSGIRPFLDKYKNSAENGDWILKDSKQNGHQSVSIQNI